MIRNLLLSYRTYESNNSDKVEKICKCNKLHRASVVQRAVCVPEVKPGVEWAMLLQTGMAECISKVETTTRLAQLRVDSLGSGCYRRSDPFKIGLWNWYASIPSRTSTYA